jgi:hypothetical protein
MGVPWVFFWKNILMGKRAAGFLANFWSGSSGFCSVKKIAFLRFKRGLWPPRPSQSGRLPLHPCEEAALLSNYKKVSGQPPAFIEGAPEGQWAGIVPQMVMEKPTSAGQGGGQHIKHASRIFLCWSEHDQIPPKELHKFCMAMTRQTKTGQISATPYDHILCHICLGLTLFFLLS